MSTTERVLTGLVRDHYDSERARLRAAGAGGGGSASGFESMQTLELQSECGMVSACTHEAVDALRRERLAGKVPDYFCCKITMDVMIDPVTTPDGITYERSALTEHLRKVGTFDPVTRREISISQLSSNLALKEAITAYLESNPWAYEGV